MSDESETTIAEFEKALAESREGTYRLRLYVTGTTDRSARAIGNIRTICEEHLMGRYELEVIDLYQQPELAREGQVLAAPTLVKELPTPVRRVVGDMSDEGRVLFGLDIARVE